MFEFALVPKPTIQTQDDLWAAAYSHILSGGAVSFPSGKQNGVKEPWSSLRGYCKRRGMKVVQRTLNNRVYIYQG